MGTPVPMDALEPGDIVSFHGSGHAGIYIGGGQNDHAPHHQYPSEFRWLA
jgi:cell wall-associated NlpC family hydrolase